MEDFLLSSDNFNKITKYHKESTIFVFPTIKIEEIKISYKDITKITSMFNKSESQRRCFVDLKISFD